MRGKDYKLPYGLVGTWSSNFDCRQCVANYEYDLSCKELHVMNMNYFDHWKQQFSSSE